MSVRSKSILVAGARSLLGTHIQQHPWGNSDLRRISRRPTIAAEVVGDLRNTADADRAVEGCETILHVAMQGPSSGSARATRHRETDNADVTRAVLEAAQRGGVQRVVVGVPTSPAPDASRGLLDAIASARTAGQDVRVLRHPSPVGAGDVGPSWLGRAMLRFAAGSIRTFVPGSLALVPATDVVSALAGLAGDDAAPNSEWSLPGEVLDARELLELWADGFGPRSRPWSRPGALLNSRLGSATPWVRRLLREDFDPRDAGAPPPATSDSLPPATSVTAALEQSIAWFTAHGHVRLAREQQRQAS
ncbi:MAG: NAD-dependent epimerase/dehydratase family protein [Nannocystales bacterium]